MSSPTDLTDDPDTGARAVGEQVSAVTSGHAATRKISIASIAVGSISLHPVRDPLLASAVPFPPQSHFWSRSGLLMAGLFASILGLAFAGVIAITQFPFVGSGSQPAIRAELSVPELVVQSSHGISGEPAPLGLRVQGLAEGAVVLIRGLVPGMELSTGRSVGGDAWQLSAEDLHYAWIAPPEGFVGSADLIAELRLSNDQIADRQAIHLEWMTPVSPAPGEHQLDREKITAAPSISSEVAQPPIDRKGIGMAPSISTEPAQRQVNRKEKRLLKRGKADFGIARRDAKDASRHAPFTDAYAGDSTNAPKGFWDWSR
jgi:hypothetical protein